MKKGFKHSEEAKRKISLAKFIILKDKKCKTCKNIFSKKPGISTKKWVTRKYCSIKCQYPDTTKPLEEKFWSKVKKTDECWEWQGYRSNYGYGLVQYMRNSLATHRVSWELHNGKIPKGLFVCHKCDNPPCVRPDHLFLGTHKDNMQDKIKKGRDNTPLWALKKYKTRKEIAEDFNISPSHMCAIIRGESWKHI